MPSVQTISNSNFLSSIQPDARVQENPGNILSRNIHKVGSAHATNLGCMNKHGNLFAGIPIQATNTRPGTIINQHKQKSLTNTTHEKPTPVQQHKLNRHGNLFAGIHNHATSTRPGMIVNRFKQDPRTSTIRDKSVSVAPHKLNLHGNLFEGMPRTVRLVPDTSTAAPQEKNAIVRQHNINRHGNLFAGIPVDASTPSDADRHADMSSVATDKIIDDAFAFIDEWIDDEIGTGYFSSTSNTPSLDISAEEIYANGFDDGAQSAKDRLDFDLDTVESNTSSLNSSLEEISERGLNKDMDKTSISSDIDSGIHSDDENTIFESVRKLRNFTSETPGNSSTSRSWNLPPRIEPLDLMAFVNKKTI